VRKPASLWNERINRLHRAVGSVDVSHPATNCPLIAVTCSRLGHDSNLHRYACQFLCRSLLDCRQRQASLLVTSGTAIEPWAVRAAELFAVPIVRLSVDSNDESADIVVQSQHEKQLSRDAVAIALADRVDAVYVRRGGIIESCLRLRVTNRCDASTRVAVSMTGKCAAAGLIAAGAIGWFRATTKAKGIAVQHSTDLDPPLDDRVATHDAWTRTDGQWLIHCTRSRHGAWPGETERQYRDSILLGDESSQRREPLDALEKIVRSGRIVAAATATMKKHAVVCFSALPLQELLERRCFRPQLGRWDYEPYGIAVRLSVARQLGIQPVIYGQPKDRSAVSVADRFRFHPIGKTFDWREEREWRSSQSVDLSAMDPADVRIFAADQPEAKFLLRDCRWPVTFLPAAPSSGPTGVTAAGKQV
jgi:hypothetical protein